MQVIKPSLKLQFLLVMLAISYLGTVVVLLLLTSILSDPRSIQQLQFSHWYKDNVLNINKNWEPALPIQQQLKQFDQPLSALLKRPIDIDSLGQTSIHWFVLVDKEAHLVKAWQTEKYQNGDITSQLPMFARDDLADALVGHFNSGIESLPNGNKLIIKAIKSPHDEILGALISEQTWDFTEQPGLFSHVLNIYSIKQILLLALAPMTLILIVVLVLIFVASKRLKNDWQEFVRVISFWQKGDFSPKLPTNKPIEIASSFVQLNAMADALAQHIEKQQQQTEMRERQLLAAELHDTVKQTLFANNLALATGLNLLNQDNNEAAAQYLQEAIKGNQLAFSQMSQLIDTLPKAELKRLDIATFTQALENQFNEQALSIDFTYDLSQPVLTKNLILCQKVLIEALQNVKKHSNATRVKIHFSQSKQGKLLHCQLVDDGSVSDIMPQQGLTLMKQRIEQASGEIHIEAGTTAPYLGVKITLCLNN